MQFGDSLTKSMASVHVGDLTFAPGTFAKALFCLRFRVTMVAVGFWVKIGVGYSDWCRVEFKKSVKLAEQQMSLEHES